MKKIKCLVAWVLAFAMVCTNINYVKAETVEGKDSAQTEQTSDVSDVTQEESDEGVEELVGQAAPEETVSADAMDEAVGDNLASGVWRGMDWVIDSEGMLTISGTYVDEKSEDPYPAWVYPGNVYGVEINYENHITSDMSEKIVSAKITASNVKSAAYLFYRLSALKSIDLSEFNTSNVTDMRLMFSGCKSLISLDVSKFDTSKVTDMYNMFCDCSSLTSLDVSKFDTSNVASMEGMFSYCSSLTSLDVSKFDTSNKVLPLSRTFLI